MKLTPWFPANVTPTRVGVYERGYRFNGMVNVFLYPYCFWDGDKWFGIGVDPEDAAQHDGFIASSFHGALWRGLASKDGK